MANPFDAFRALLADMPEAEAPADAAADALGRLADVAAFLAAWQGGDVHVDNPLVAVFAGSHGVQPQGGAEAAARIARLQAGDAPINQICKTYDISLKAYELALTQPTGDIAQGDALDERACAATMAFGMEALASEPDVLALGAIGPGGEIAAAAIFCALHGGAPEDWLGPDAAKADAARRALAFHHGRLDDPLDVLRKLGGREIAAAAGAILSARHARTPVLLDGLVVAAAAAVLRAVHPAALDHCLAAEAGPPGQVRAWAALAKTPLLNLGLKLGEGEGAALAVALAKAAVAVAKPPAAT